MSHSVPDAARFSWSLVAAGHQAVRGLALRSRCGHLEGPCQRQAHMEGCAVTNSNPARRSDPDSSSKIVASSSTTSNRAGTATAFTVPECEPDLTDP